MTDGYLNCGNAHWFICKRHKTKWLAGENLFSSAMDETEDQQRAEQQRLGFEHFLEVEPHIAAPEGIDYKCDCARCSNMSPSR